MMFISSLEQLWLLLASSLTSSSFSNLNHLPNIFTGNRQKHCLAWKHCFLVYAQVWTESASLRLEVSSYCSWPWTHSIFLKWLESSRQHTEMEICEYCRDTKRNESNLLSAMTHVTFFWEHQHYLSSHFNKCWKCKLLN